MVYLGEKVDLKNNELLTKHGIKAKIQKNGIK